MADTSNKRTQLSPAERAMIAEGKFGGDFTPDGLLERMRLMLRFDSDNAAALRRARRLLTFGILFALAGLVWNGLMGHSALGNLLPAPLMYGVAALGLLMAIAGGVLLRRLGTIDVSRNFRDVALPFLALLKQDMEPDANIHVRIDLREPRHENKRRGTPRTQPGSGGTRSVETIYHDAWFNGVAALADGSTLRWDVDDHIVDRTRTKRSRSNKLKTKSRSIKRTVISVALTVANERYRVEPAAASKDAKVAVRDGDKRSTIKLVRKIKSKSLDPINPRVLVDAVSGAYRRLAAPARGAA